MENKRSQPSFHMNKSATTTVQPQFESASPSTKIASDTHQDIQGNW